jgi:hypothetical protein
MSLTAPNRLLKFKKNTISQAGNVELHEVKLSENVNISENDMS